MRYLVHGMIGSIPGLILAMSSLRLGLAWAFAGALLFAAFAINGVSLRRVFRLFIAIMITRNLPIPKEWLLPSEDELSPVERVREQTVEDWFYGRDIIDRRGRFILLAILAGVLVSMGVVYYDLWLADADAAKIFVFAEPKISVWDKVVLLLVIVPGATGGAVSLFVCPAYGRPVMACNIIPVIATIAMLIAGFDKVANMPILFAIASWLGMGLGLLFGLDE